MINLKIEISNFQTVSTNNLKRINYKTGRVYPAKGVGQKKQVLANKLKDLKEQIDEFVSNIDTKRHYLKAEYYFFIPTDKLFTKKQVISKTSKDLDNHLKFLQDEIFKQLKVDDSLICQLETAKLPSWNNGYHITVNLSLWELTNLWTLRGLYRHIKGLIFNDDV